MRKHQILSRPTHPLAIDGHKSVAALLEKIQGISFQGRALATAYQIWKKMLGDRVMIMMGMSGAMVPAGM
jgi:deoxyhypusine synthase